MTITTDATSTANSSAETDDTLSVPEGYKTWISNPSFKAHVVANTLAVLVGGSLAGLGLLYVSMKQVDWVTSFYLGLGVTFLLAIPLTSAYVWAKTKKDDKALQQFIYDFSDYAATKHGLILTENDIKLLLAGERVGVNVNNVRRIVYISTFVNGSDIQIFYANDAVEFPATLHHIIHTTLDIPKKFVAKTNVRRITLGVTVGLTILLAVLFNVAILLFGLNGEDDLFTSRTFILSILTAVLLAVTAIPFVVKRSQQLPTKVEVMVKNLLAFAKKRYGLKLSREEALLLLEPNRTVTIYAYDDRLAVTLNTLADRTDARLLADSSNEHLPTFS